jgi:hypothetical protein
MVLFGFSTSYRHDTFAVCDVFFEPRLINQPEKKYKWTKTNRSVYLDISGTRINAGVLMACYLSLQNSQRRDAIQNVTTRLGEANR